MLRGAAINERSCLLLVWRKKHENNNNFLTPKHVNQYNLNSSHFINKDILDYIAITLYDRIPKDHCISDYRGG